MYESFFPGIYTKKWTRFFLIQVKSLFSIPGAFVPKFRIWNALKSLASTRKNPDDSECENIEQDAYVNFILASPKLKKVIHKIPRLSRCITRYFFYLQSIWILLVKCCECVFGSFWQHFTWFLIVVAYGTQIIFLLITFTCHYDACSNFQFGSNKPKFIHIEKI